MRFSIDEVLVLVSFAMVAPAMFVALAAVFSGALRRSEGSRYLPLRHRETDYWETGTAHELPRGRGET